MHPFIIFQNLVPQHLLSRIIGSIAKSEICWIKNLFIKAFIRWYKVNMQEAESSTPEDYRSFNHFFTRRLRPNQRQILGDLASPCDGRVSQAGQIKDGRLLQVKGIDYSINRLMGKNDVGKYLNGSFITIYLSPKDYHRVHAPIDCEIIQSRYIPGRLFSVNQLTTNQVEGLFTRNERLICELDTRYGAVSLIFIGAMIVAGIKTVWSDSPYTPNTCIEEKTFKPSNFKQGMELGHFELGSTVILAAQKQMDWNLAPGDQIQLGQSLINFADSHGQN